jgi:hypothetical protein
MDGVRAEGSVLGSASVARSELLHPRLFERVGLKANAAVLVKDLIDLASADRML